MKTLITAASHHVRTGHGQNAEDIKASSSTTGGENASLVADAARSLFALAYFAGAAFNLVYTLRHPGVFDSWLESPLLSGYRWFFVDIVGESAWFWVPLAVAGEIVLGVLLLARGQLVRIGIALSILFQLLLAPMWVGQTLINLLLAIVQMPLLRAAYPKSIHERLRGLMPG